MTGPRSHPNPRLRRLRPPDGAPAPNPYYRACRRMLQVLLCAFWSVRIFDRHREPASGGVLYICNHQSYLDPMLMSFALRRPMNYMAAEFLFAPPGFRRLIRSLNAFPVRRGVADTRAMKESVRRLKAGGQLVVFAEGTRTWDGRIGPFLPGVALLARRAAAWTVPVVIDGAFEAWPRTQRLPRPGRIAVQYGRPRRQTACRARDGKDLLAGIRNEMIALQADLRDRTGRGPLHYEA
ncbi:MAG: 1-acyl-sn-glycerol-3-phosphate acyltransferase [Phycisphaerae bacterium]|nr:1-acyl-sn-glycerol-3-phosphate acyltransferase [Phycisphaerae bacterium]